MDKQEIDWEKGTRYELFIGSKYEELGYRVEYIGQMFGYNDHGIDLIAHSQNEIILIQCKFRTGQKVENGTIYKLYNNANEFRKLFKTPKKYRITAITNTNFTNEDWDYANSVGILIQTFPISNSFQCSKNITIPNMRLGEYVAKNVIESTWDTEKDCALEPIQESIKEELLHYKMSLRDLQAKVSRIENSLYEIKNDTTIMIADRYENNVLNDSARNNFKKITDSIYKRIGRIQLFIFIILGILIALVACLSGIE